MRKKIRLFDASSSLPYNRGKLAETFFSYKDVKRSNHPLRSVMAMGRSANYFTSTHPLHDPEGKKSPLYKFYKKFLKSQNFFFPPRRQATLSWLGGFAFMRNPHKGHQEPGTRVGGVRIKAWRLLGRAAPPGRALTAGR